VGEAQAKQTRGQTGGEKGRPARARILTQNNDFQTGPLPRADLRGRGKSYSDVIIRVARGVRENAHRFIIIDETAGSGVLAPFVCF
jgi:hypothetical protein